MFVDDVVALLVEAGLGVAGENILIGPGGRIDPEQVTLSVIATGGQNPEGTHNMVDAPAYVRPSAQIVARAAKSIDAENKAQAAWNAMFKVRNRFVNGTWWRQTTMTQEPFPIDPDDRGLFRVAFNFSCVKRQSAATS
jgi:hypothetical protein